MDRELNTMERMVLCSALQQDMATLIQILDSVKLITEIAGPPPEHIKVEIQAQVSEGMRYIFEHAAQA